MMKTCQWCDKEFEAKRKNSRYCYEPHYKDCEACGEPFIIKEMKRPGKTCSKSCSDALTQQGSTVSKRCQWCGDDFLTTNRRAKFCDKDHYGTCSVCGDEFTVSNVHKPAKTCSPRCAWSSVEDKDAVYQKTQDTLEERYGFRNASRVSEVKEKKRRSAVSRYGVENVSQAPEVQQKRKKTFQQRFGHDNPYLSEVVRDKAKATNLKRYGAENVFQSPEVKEKIRIHFQEKYGVSNPSEIPEVRRRARYTSKKLYGTEYYTQSKPFADYPEKLEEWNNLSSWAKSQSSPPSIRKVSKYFNVHSATVCHKIAQEGIERSLFTWQTSHLEQDFISAFEGIPYKRNDRSKISPLELDFLFLDQALAVEISPSATHHSGMEERFKEAFIAAYGENSWLAGKSIPSSYHRRKFDLCENAGIELLTYFDWMDWDKFVEMVRYKLSSDTRRVYARKTTAFKLQSRAEKSIARDFLKSNHLMGSRPSEVYYGLKDENDNLLAVASFARGRRFGSATDQDNDIYELSRLSFQKGVNIPGGASKLIKNFCRDNLQARKLYTFSDNDIGNGRVYGSIGFSMTEDNKGGLNYVHPYVKKGDVAWKINPVSLHRQGADRLLKSFPNYAAVGIGENLPSNEEIVMSYGFIPVFDCGYRKWEMDLSAE